MVGGDVERVLGDARPPRGADRAVVLPFLGRLIVPILAVADAATSDAVGRSLAQLVHQVGPAVVTDVVFQGGRVVVGVYVGIDDWVIETGTDHGRRRGLAVDECGHG